jgi:methyl-accepting chemotaxis protein
MDLEKSTKKKNIGIVGGGKVGLELYLLFSQSQQTRVEYVVDISPTAPAVAAAQRAGVHTYTDLNAALLQPVDFIVEVTGSAKLLETISQQIAQTRTCLITHDMAFIFLTVIGENNQRVKNQVLQEIREVKLDISNSLGSLGSLVGAIEDTTSQMNILSINARIEAARVGEQGKGFAVVASEIATSSGKVKEITQQIQQVNRIIEKASDQIDTSLDRLK